MEKQEWQVPELTEIDVAEQTEFDPFSGGDGGGGSLGVDPGGGS